VLLYGCEPTNSACAPDFSVPRPFINLDATTLPVGPLNVWSNNNALGITFVPPAGQPANVQIVSGTAAVMFFGTNYYSGIGVEPFTFAGNSNRTVTAWVYSTTTPPPEQTVFAWGRRGGNPDGSNNALSYGRDPSFGAIQFWGAADLPWGTNTTQINNNTP